MDKLPKTMKMPYSMRLATLEQRRWFVAGQMALAAMDAPDVGMATAMLKSLVEQGFDLETSIPGREHPDRPGSTLAERLAHFRPVYAGESATPMISALAKMGVDFNKKGEGGSSPLEHAASNGSGEAYEAMAQASESTGGALGRLDGKGMWSEPSLSPFLALWSENDCFFNTDCDFGESAKKSQACSERGRKLLEKAFTESKAEPGQWVPEVLAACIYSERARNEVGFGKIKSWHAAWDWAACWTRDLGKELCHGGGSKYGSSRLNALGLSSIENPTLALAVGIAANRLDPQSIGVAVKALCGSKGGLDKRFLWALGRVAMEFGDVASQRQASKTICSVFDALDGVRSEVAVCQALPNPKFDNPFSRGYATAQGKATAKAVAKAKAGMPYAVGLLLGPVDGARPDSKKRKGAPKSAEGKHVENIASALSWLGQGNESKSFGAFKKQAAKGFVSNFGSMAGILPLHADEGDGVEGKKGLAIECEAALERCKSLASMSKAGAELARECVCEWIRSASKACSREKSLADYQAGKAVSALCCAAMDLGCSGLGNTLSDWAKACSGKIHGEEHALAMGALAQAEAYELRQLVGAVSAPAKALRM